MHYLCSKNSSIATLPHIRHHTLLFPPLLSFVKEWFFWDWGCLMLPTTFLYRTMYCILLEMILIWFLCEYIIIFGFKINFLINQLKNINSNNDWNICICKRCIRKMKMANISFHLNRIERSMKFVWFCHIWDYQESFHGAII